MAKILVVDDEQSILLVFKSLLASQGHTVSTANDGHTALELLAQSEYNLMVSDVRMRPMNGMELLNNVREKYPKMAVIMLTAFSSIDNALESLKKGAFDYCTKPFKIDELIKTINNGLEYNKSLLNSGNNGKNPHIEYFFGRIVAESDILKRVCTEIKKVAPTDTPVLIYGEPGCGKELIARTVHECSPRNNNKFVSINCAVIPEPILESMIMGSTEGVFSGLPDETPSLFEQAEGGSVFLEEIGAMPLNIQDDLLDIIRNKSYRKVGSGKTVPLNARILASANDNLDDYVKDGTFREDLYNRINTISIEIPPLRYRPEDILPVAFKIIEEEGLDPENLPQLDPNVQAILKSYKWPGNVHQLQHVIKDAVMICPSGNITKDILPEDISSTTIANGETVNELEKTRGIALREFLKKKAVQRRC